MSSTTTNPVAQFPHPTLTPIHGKPNRVSIDRLIQEIYANAIAIESTRGGGDYGHLALVMTPAAYLTLPNAVAFQEPAHPGPAPVHPAGATAAQITEGNRVYNAAKEERTCF